MKQKNIWKTYDPSWLVELARKELPNEKWLHESLANCKQCMVASKAYTYFVNPENANKPGAQWQFEENIILNHPKEGEIVLDILKNGRVGGIEYLGSL